MIKPKVEEIREVKKVEEIGTLRVEEVKSIEKTREENKKVLIEVKGI